MGLSPKMGPKKRENFGAKNSRETLTATHTKTTRVL